MKTLSLRELQLSKSQHSSAVSVLRGKLRLITEMKVSLANRNERTGGAFASSVKQLFL